MTLSVIAAAATANTLDNFAADASRGGVADAPGVNFASIVDSALRGVSAAQEHAASVEQNYAAGVPGASLGQAVVSSDRAEIAWNAMVAVRNEAVSAYSSVMNMQF